MDVPYLMHEPDGDRLWIVDGEQRLLITPRIYDLLVRHGADMPPAYGIEELREQNARLRELVRALLTCATEGECDECRMNGATPWHVGNAQLCDGVWEHLRELGIEVK